LKEGDVVLMDQAIGGGTGLGLRPAEKATDAQRATAGEAAKAAQKSPGSKEHKRGSDGSVKPAAESNAAGRGGVGTEESPSPGSEGTGKAREQKLGATSAGEGPGVRRNSKRSRGENGNSQSEGSRERK
ncbi:hypothetical protein HY256_00500, partial [Candidatus Sumerlaeota bacterium]|nr:hypothetical protein [Candidatus Sumerlaeota bacterium]